MDQGDEGDWETVGEPAERSIPEAMPVERSRSLAPAMTEAVPQAPVAEGRTEPAVAAAKEPALLKPKRRRLLKLD
jgi:hypothetical protein